MRYYAPSAFLLLATSSAVQATPFPHPQLAVEHPVSSWRTLSNRLFQSILGLPPKQTSIHGNQADGPQDGPTPPRYGVDMVLRFEIETAEHAQALSEAANTLFLDIWEYSADWVDVRVSEDVVDSLLGLLPWSLQARHRVIYTADELSLEIQESYPEPPGGYASQRSDKSTINTTARAESNPIFTNYQPFSVIVPWMRLQASLFPTHVRMIKIGLSYEGRDIPALRIGVHPTNDEKPSGPRKTVIVSGGFHAREWISTSTVNYVAWSLITSYGKHKTVTRLLEAFDWVFIPTTNPDGYIYTWETDRLWRKNRQQTSLRFCRGLDLDRSFGFHWDGEHLRANPCSESFAGQEAFEAVEAKALATWAKNETENNNVEFVGFLDMHSYSQQILYPYSYSCKASPPGLENLEEVALGLAKAMRLSHNHAYRVASACEGNIAVTDQKEGKKELFPRMETGGGSALDWFYHELNVKYAYQVKLRDTGMYGFLLPKENIIPTGKETLDAILYFGKFLDGDLKALGEGERVEVENVSKEGGVGVEEVGVEDEGEGDEYEEINGELKRRRK